MSRIRARHVATRSARAYLPAMAARLLRSMLLLAVLLMPLRMAADAHLPAPAQASGAMAAMAEHCGGQELPDSDQPSKARADCMMACAALPAIGEVVERLHIAASAERPAPCARIHGRQHAADPPPPRFS